MKRVAPPALLLLVVGFLVTSTAPVRPQLATAADRFEVSDVMIPARDGKRLHTKIFTPRLRQGSGAGSSDLEATSSCSGGPGSDDPNNAIDEGTDTYDRLEWLIKNVRNNNGRVGMMGVSSNGWTTIMAAIEPHPARTGISPQASPADMWMGDDCHHNGAFRLSYGFEYATMMESGKDVQDFKFVRDDTFDWDLSLGPLANVNAKYLHSKIPT